MNVSVCTVVRSVKSEYLQRNVVSTVKVNESPATRGTLVKLAALRFTTP